MKCPHCGKEIPKRPPGRPQVLNDAKVIKMRKAGKSLAEIAANFKVTRGAIQAALKRSQ